MVADMRCDMVVNPLESENFSELLISGSAIKATPSLVALEDDKETVRLHLIDRGNKSFVVVITDVICFRITEERFMLSSIEDMQPFGVLGKFAMRVEQSNLIKWLADQSLQTIDDLNLTHVRLLFTEDIADFVVTDSFTIRCTEV